MPRPRTSRYGRYVNGPDPLAPPVDLSEALAEVAPDVMEGYSVERALREYLRHGGGGRLGLDQIAGRVQRRKQELLSRYQLGDTLAEVERLRQSAVLEERKQLARDIDLDDLDRAFREVWLDSLPASTAAAVEELADYDWRSPAARAAYERIRDLMGRELLDQHFAGMKQALENATDADRESIQEMLSDLNDLLSKHRRGEDDPADFEAFMGKHGDYFPQNPRDVEELIDVLAERSAAARRMYNSMSPEQREELLSLAAQAFGSPEIGAQLALLDESLQSLRPHLDWSSSEEFGGQQGLGLGDGAGVLGDLAELDSLVAQLGQGYGGAQMGDIDVDALTRQVGAESGVAARTLAELEKALRSSGYLTKASDGTLMLSPQAMRQLGRSFLADVADRTNGRLGRRETHNQGAAGELTGSTRQWAFGDTESWDVSRTLLNAVAREPEHASGRPIRVRLDDVEVSETQARTQAVVALLVDTSFSMAAEGRWLPMKRTALALHQLVSTKWRGDQLQLITFARLAQSMEAAELIGLPALREQGTNLHHGLLLAERLFRRYRRMQPVLLVVTDGEPTAHLTPEGDPWFRYPPSTETLRATVRQLDRLGRLKPRVTFFRLGEDPGLERFLRQLAHRIDGRVVSPSLDDLGSAVVQEYLLARRSSQGESFPQ